MRSPAMRIGKMSSFLLRLLVPSLQKALLLQLQGLQEEQVKSFQVTLADRGDLYNGEVAIFGPPNTYSEGCYFKAGPPLPPTASRVRHVCICIFHPRWMTRPEPGAALGAGDFIQNLRTILLGFLSLLKEASTFSRSGGASFVMHTVEREQRLRRRSRASPGSRSWHTADAEPERGKRPTLPSTT